MMLSASPNTRGSLSSPVGVPTCRAAYHESFLAAGILPAIIAETAIVVEDSREEDQNDHDDNYYPFPAAAKNTAAAAAVVPKITHL